MVAAVTTRSGRGIDVPGVRRQRRDDDDGRHVMFGWLLYFVGRCRGALVTLLYVIARRMGIYPGRAVLIAEAFVWAMMVAMDFFFCGPLLFSSSSVPSSLSEVREICDDDDDDDNDDDGNHDDDDDEDDDGQQV